MQTRLRTRLGIPADAAIAEPTDGSYTVKDLTSIVTAEQGTSQPQRRLRVILNDQSSRSVQGEFANASLSSNRPDATMSGSSSAATPSSSSSSSTSSSRLVILRRSHSGSDRQAAPQSLEPAIATVGRSATTQPPQGGSARSRWKNVGIDAAMALVGCGSGPHVTSQQQQQLSLNGFERPGSGLFSANHWQLGVRPWMKVCLATTAVKTTASGVQGKQEGRSTSTSVPRNTSWRTQLDADLHARSRQLAHEQRLQLLLLAPEGGEALYREHLLQNKTEPQQQTKKSTRGNSSSHGSEHTEERQLADAAALPQHLTAAGDEKSLRVLSIIDRIDQRLQVFQEHTSVAVLQASSTHHQHRARGLQQQQQQSSSSAPNSTLKRKSTPLSAAHQWVEQVYDAVTPSRLEDALSHSPLYQTRLMKFQKESVAWITNAFVMRRLGCILGDEMGLGKTIQSISIVSAIAHALRLAVSAAEGSVTPGLVDFVRPSGRRSTTAFHNKKNNTPFNAPPSLCDHFPPFLIVAPLSTIPNWQSEFQRFLTAEESTLVRVVALEDAATRGETVQSTVAQFFPHREWQRVRKRKRRSDSEESSSSLTSSESDVERRQRQRRAKATRNGTPMAAGAGGTPTMQDKNETTSNPQKRRYVATVFIAPHDIFGRPMPAPLQALLHLPYSLIIVDEAQRIKNADCQVFTSLARLRSAYRLVLTGTPLQNSIHEMFSLLEFIAPNVVSRSDDAVQTLLKDLHEALRRATMKSRELEDAELEVLLCRRVHRLLAPFMIRRERNMVLDQLPSKEDHILVCPVSRVQQQYLDALEHRRAHRILTGNATLYARKIVMHPYLLLRSFYVESRMVYASGKFVMLDLLLQSLQKTKRKTLVFSSWTKVLDIAESLCQFRGVQYVRLDGNYSSAARQESIVKFQQKRTSVDSSTTTPTTANPASSSDSSSSFHANDPAGPNDDAETGEVSCFLISKVAGGVGLNLQAADTVILLDVDYNPQRDAQALSRAYRVGQTQHVKVFRLVVAHPTEQRMCEIAETKRRMDDAVVGAGRYDLTSSTEDRDAALKQLFESMRAPPPTADAVSQFGEVMGGATVFANETGHKDSSSEFSPHANDGGRLRPIKEEGPNAKEEHESHMTASGEDPDPQQQLENNLIPSPISQPTFETAPASVPLEESCFERGVLELLTSQLLQTVPRSDIERASLVEWIPEYWNELRAAYQADLVKPLEEEERLFLNWKRTL